MFLKRACKKDQKRILIALASIFFLILITCIVLIQKTNPPNNGVNSPFSERERTKEAIELALKRSRLSSESREKQYLEDQGSNYGYTQGKLKEINDEEHFHLQNKVYLDYTGAAPYPASVLTNSYSDLFQNFYANTHSRSQPSLQTNDLIEKFRSKLLEYFNTESGQYSVVFTSGTTQALKLVGEAFPFSRNSKFAYLNQNHNSVIGIREYALLKQASFHSLKEENIQQFIKDEKELGDVNENKDKNENGQGQGEGEEEEEEVTFNLFAYPAESNFDGSKYDLNWIKDFQSIKNNDWLVLLDAAAFLPSNKLDLTKYPADFVTLSFYKMFGYPTGLGALIINNDIVHLLQKSYFGGGTVVLVSDCTTFCVRHPNPSTKLEDGTLPFLDIITAKYGLEFIENLGIDQISQHIYHLGKYLVKELSKLKWSNGNPLVEIYGKWDLNQDNNFNKQGGIVTFNLLDTNNNYLNFNDVQASLESEGINLRTGCHCNPGACTQYFGINEDDLKQAAEEKESCGDDIIFINNKPLGAIRASLGYGTMFEHIDYLIQVINMKYIEKEDNF
ncbi:molybdenum cofactor sulfurase [Anaeramoeba flamelloides]|uniref:Molybdenum cofactor sulfurase n=1 Tax=Anaeramoeba flamelloides TaxID=1746091 RepID=A0AAV8A3P8_9EUKA|nr:molybdenum cofactor sulfurase [Anaeramoeba flamelloides]|eukprot:Anaeramoba_flamelloidesc39424_g1_i1.p1 GENE.c39424_g1_i1~~c39424_g1_i1.p1  ORF type:complete len:561 (-),score=137.21 c39424_g1_i1:100-1782(-)